MWEFKDHGKSFEAVYGRDMRPGFRWLHESFGTNWRMTEMQAVLGRIHCGEWRIGPRGEQDRDGLSRMSGEVR